MNRGLVVGALLVSVAACVFAPDLSRFPPCATGGTCPAGYSCLQPERLCLPDCGARGPCLPDDPPSPPDPPEPGDGGTRPSEPDDAGTPGPDLPPLLLAGPAILADFQSSQDYEEQLSAVGGQPPYRFELVDSNTMPPGLILNDQGAVQGRTSAAGTSFKVQVTDSAQPPQSVTRVLQIRASDCTLTRCIRTRSVPDGQVGTPYGYTLRATGMTASTWKVESGALPPGVELRLPTGQLVGTPTMSGRYDFIVSVTDVVTTARSALLSLEVH